MRGSWRWCLNARAQTRVSVSVSKGEVQILSPMSSNPVAGRVGEQGGSIFMQQDAKCVGRGHTAAFRGDTQNQFCALVTSGFLFLPALEILVSTYVNQPAPLPSCFARGARRAHLCSHQIPSLSQKQRALKYLWS